jgi:uncharacterized membrane protein YgcG
MQAAPRKKAPPLKPSPGFNTLKEEKLHFLLALKRMKADGVEGITEYTVESDLEEMRMELKAFEQDETIRTGIMTCRSAIVTFAAWMEVANTRFNPFDLDINGFSESLFEKIERYDGVFKRLVRKYSRRAANVSPEMQLMMMFVGNAFTFCFTKSMMKSMQPSMTKIAEENPEMVKKMMEGILREQMAKGQAPSFAAAEGGQEAPDFMQPPMSTRGPVQQAEVYGPKRRSKRPRSESSAYSSSSSGGSGSYSGSEGSYSGGPSEVSSKPERKRKKAVRPRFASKRPPMAPLKAVRPHNDPGSGTETDSVSSIQMSLAASSAANGPPMQAPLVRTTVRKVPVKRGGSKISKVEVDIH